MNTKRDGFREGAAFMLILVLFSGCATDISSNSYSDDSVGDVAQTEAAVVVKVRTVKVGPDQLGKSHTGAVAGGIGGALIGAAAEKKLKSGALRTVVQGGDVSFVKGERILLMTYAYGRSKVVKDNDQT